MCIKWGLDKGMCSNKILQQNPLSNTINLTMTENGTQIKNDYS